MPSGEEEVDVAADLRAYLDETAARLDTLDHYDLLEVARDADIAAVKRAYFRLVGLVHPDRFFGKRLGRYAPPLRRVFERLSQAYETLVSPSRRAEYDLVHPPTRGGRLPPRRPAPVPEGRHGRDAAPVDARAAAMDALKARFVEGKAMARRHADAAERARAAGDLETAVAEYATALRHAPRDPVLEKGHADALHARAARAAESRKRQALLEERYGHWNEAAASWRRVLELSPGDAEATARLANAVARSGPRGR